MIEQTSIDAIECGSEEAKKAFGLAKGWVNLNHGKYGGSSVLTGHLD
jgi:hypothetical protein